MWIPKWNITPLLVAGIFSIFNTVAQAAGIDSNNTEVTNQETRIVGGAPVTNRSQFYYQASIRYKSSNYHFCGGTIISNRVILTAAHCVVDAVANNLLVVVGDLDKSTTTANTTRAEVATIRYHSGYDSDNVINDVAVLILKTNLTFSSYINAIPLAETAPSNGTNCTISGWGTLSYQGTTPSILQYATVPIVDRTTCSRAYGGFGMNGMICAGYINTGGVDACQGDSGGPLACNGRIAGIVSWGYQCALPGYPGVYADVAYYRNWIEANSGSSKIVLTVLTYMLGLLCFLFN